MSDTFDTFRLWRGGDVKGTYGTRALTCFQFMWMAQNTWFAKQGGQGKVSGAGLAMFVFTEESSASPGKDL